MKESSDGQCSTAHRRSLRPILSSPSSTALSLFLHRARASLLSFLPPSPSPFLLSSPRRPRKRRILAVARRHLRTCRTPSRLRPLQSPSPFKAPTTCRQTATRNPSLPLSAYRGICPAQSRTTSSTMILSLLSPSPKTPILPRLPHGQHLIMATNPCVSPLYMMLYALYCTAERPHNVEGLERDALCSQSRSSLCPLAQVVPLSVTAPCAPTPSYNAADHVFSAAMYVAQPSDRDFAVERPNVREIRTFIPVNTYARPLF